MGGRLPQYWGNLGVSLIMQSRYDEAETALKKAIEIDPEYILARNNLEKLPEVRRVGTVDMRGYASISSTGYSSIHYLLQTGRS